MQKGKFIVVEGGEGSGKSTIVDRLKKNGIGDIFLNDPSSGNDTFKSIRQLLLSKKSITTKKSELLLYLASRNILTENHIIPALNEGKTVICDRFDLSTLVYQGCIRGFDISLLNELHNQFCGIFPDRYLIFDVEAKTGLYRSISRLEHGNIDESKWEEMGLKIHEKINASFLKMAKTYRINHTVIDTNDKSLNTVYNEVKEILMDIL